MKSNSNRIDSDSSVINTNAQVISPFYNWRLLIPRSYDRHDDFFPSMAFDCLRNFKRDCHCRIEKQCDARIPFWRPSHPKGWVIIFYQLRLQRTKEPSPTQKQEHAGTLSGWGSMIKARINWSILQSASSIPRLLTSLITFKQGFNNCLGIWRRERRQQQQQKQQQQHRRCFWAAWTHTQESILFITM